MAQKTITTYICDRCKAESDSKDFNDGSTCGNLIFNAKGHTGGLCMGKDWGGVNIEYKEKLLCKNCLEDFKKFMKGE